MHHGLHRNGRRRTHIRAAPRMGRDTVLMCRGRAVPPRDDGHEHDRRRVWPKLLDRTVASTGPKDGERPLPPSQTTGGGPWFLDHCQRMRIGSQTTVPGYGPRTPDPPPGDGRAPTCGPTCTVVAPSGCPASVARGNLASARNVPRCRRASRTRCTGGHQGATEDCAAIPAPRARPPLVPQRRSDLLHRPRRQPDLPVRPRLRETTTRADPLESTTSGVRVKGPKRRLSAKPRYPGAAQPRPAPPI